MPSKFMHMTERGLSAVLERTKTTGAGKKIEILHMFISHDLLAVKQEQGNHGK